MTLAFTADAARALGGPDWLVQRRLAAAEELGAPGDQRAPGGGPWAAEAGKHAAMLVVRDGRVVHHELDPALESKGVRVCDIATCDDDTLRELLGRASGATPDAFTTLHDAFLA